MVLLQKLLSYYFPWFATMKWKRESESESESESERESERGSSPTQRFRRRASAPGMIELSNLRPPSSTLSVYHDAVVSIETDSDSDAS